MGLPRAVGPSLRKSSLAARVSAGSEVGGEGDALASGNLQRVDQLQLARARQGAHSRSVCSAMSTWFENEVRAAASSKPQHPEKTASELFVK